jgi:chemotaxis family two-component system response regulator Rcp1
VDIYVIQRIVADFRQDLHLRVIPDGIEALLFLREPPPLAHAPRPALILLDLKLPQLDGALLLPQIRQLPAYQATSIIVFSGTPKEREGELASDWERPPTCKSQQTLQASVIR